MTNVPTARVFSVPDISCDHCVKSITEQLGQVEGIDSVDVDLSAKTVSVVGGDESSIVAAIDEAGFDVAS